MSDLWGVLLAAGRSRRFGSPKLLHPLEHDVPMGVMAARQLTRALPNSVVVLHPDDDELRRLLAAEGIGIVLNPDAEQGMGTSIACGIRALPPATGFVIALADMPWIDPQTIRGVASLLRTGAPIAAPVYRGQRGHPVGFCHRHREELLSLSGDHGARDLLVRHAGAMQLFEVDDAGILRDVDTPADLVPDSTPIGLC